MYLGITMLAMVPSQKRKKTGRLILMYILQVYGIKLGRVWHSSGL